MTTLAAGALQGPDYFVLVGYFALMLGIGAYFYRYIHRMKDYFSGGNRIPWWLSGVSYYMSCFSVFAFIAYAALAWEYGWLGVTVFWVMAPATLVSVIFFSKRWRRARIEPAPLEASLPRVPDERAEPPALVRIEPVEGDLDQVGRVAVDDGRRREQATVGKREADVEVDVGRTDTR